MVFSCLSPLGWLERCPTYKEQLRELTTREINTYAFLGYPVLQAADILLYKAGVVPVGEDQLPHVELTREIAKRFNHLVKQATFPEPQAELTAVSRLLGTDGRKMSKSYDNYIGLSEEPDAVRKKVMSMFTDPQRIKRTDPGRPEVCNVHTYYKVFAAGQACAEAGQQCRAAERGCTDCKQQLAGILSEYLKPIQDKRNSLVNNKKKIFEILEQGKQKAGAIAAATMSEVRATVGL
jgi:tryptophanyl-tRNA synthetase